MSLGNFVDQSGVTRLRASGGGGGSMPVGCVLEVYPLDVHGSTVPLCKWTALFDNPKDLTPLAEIPAGLGLAFAFDGSDETITTTEAGTWVFTMGISPPPDATWAGAAQLDQNNYTRSGVSGPDNSGGVQVAVGETISVPAGYSFNPQVYVTALSTVSPLNADVYLSIVRLA